MYKYVILSRLQCSSSYISRGIVGRFMRPAHYLSFLKWKWPLKIIHVRFVIFITKLLLWKGWSYHHFCWKSLGILKVPLTLKSISFLNSFEVKKCGKKQFSNIKKFSQFQVYFKGKLFKSFCSELVKTFLFYFQLCEERMCQEEVSILAINYMDRVLSKLPITKNNLQLLAATCTFLASKLREPSTHALQPEVLIYYTDNSITKKDLIVSDDNYSLLNKFR